MRKLPREIYPIYSNLWRFWLNALKFIKGYVGNYYGLSDNEDSPLYADKELVAFYDVLMKAMGVDKKFKLKKFNLINVLAHFVCTATIWHSHLNGAVSFDYSIDPKFNGLKVTKGATGNSMGSYVEYCLVVLSKGWDLRGFNGATNVLIQKKLKEEYLEDTFWSRVLLDDDEDSGTSWSRVTQNKKLFRQFFEGAAQYFDHDYADNEVAPYKAMDPRYVATSIMM